jgi:hypothetical protein
VDSNFHGILKFYTYDSDTKEWWAKFSDGQCVEVWCVEYRRSNNFTQCCSQYCIFNPAGSPTGTCCSF